MIVKSFLWTLCSRCAIPNFQVLNLPVGPVSKTVNWSKGRTQGYQPQLLSPELTCDQLPTFPKLTTIQNVIYVALAIRPIMSHSLRYVEGMSIESASSTQLGFWFITDEISTSNQSNLLNEVGMMFFDWNLSFSNERIEDWIEFGRIFDNVQQGRVKWLLLQLILLSLQVTLTIDGLRRGPRIA